MAIFFTVQNQESGMRLDRFLVLHLPELSRNLIQKNIKAGNVTVNEQKIEKRNYRVKAGEIISAIIESSSEQKHITPKDIPLSIIDEGPDIVVIDKPIGMTVHPAKGNWDNTLVNALMYKYQNFKDVGESVRFGLIHRIDKDTSGIVLAALNEKALWYYSRQFEEREVQKGYLAIVKGDISPLFKNNEYVQVSNYIARHPKNRKKMAVVDKSKGRSATTFFYSLGVTTQEQYGICSLVLAVPKTGRTHQIRVHLKHLGYPIIGDPLYTRERSKDRMFLHAYAIRIKNLKGKDVTYRAEIPKEFFEFPFKWNSVKTFTQKVLSEK